jgi:hypothetical protein
MTPVVLFFLGEAALATGIGIALWRIASDRSFSRGYQLGRQTGKDEQWLEDYLAESRKAAQKPRDSYGRFSVNSEK